MLLLLLFPVLSVASRIAETPFDSQTLDSVSNSEDDAKRSFASFMKKYNRNYADSDEMSERYRIFIKNLETIRHLNSLAAQKRSPVIYGVTQYADLTSDEYVNKHGYSAVEPLNFFQTPEHAAGGRGFKSLQKTDKLDSEGEGPDDKDYVEFND